MKKLYILMLAVALSQITNAQNIFNFTETNNLVYGRFGIEPTYVISGGYMHSFNIKKIERNIAVFGQFSSPIKLFGIKNHEIKTGGVIPVFKYKSFGTTWNLNLSTGHVETKNFNSQKYALANKLLIGVFKNKWYIAFSGEYEKILCNKISHTQYYRDYIFPEAKDGWYKNAGGNLQLGLELGFTLKKVLDINLDIKMPKSEKFNSYNGSPGHVNIMTAYKF